MPANHAESVARNAAGRESSVVVELHFVDGVVSR